MANPWTPPTLADFRTRFPEFSEIDDDVISPVLNDTINVWIAGESWNTQGDYTLAVLYWTAHYVALQQTEQFTAGLGGSGSSEADLFMRSISIGDRHVTFAQRQYGAGGQGANGPGEDSLGFTIYGQYFLMLRGRNIMPIAVI